MALCPNPKSLPCGCEFKTGPFLKGCQSEPNKKADSRGVRRGLMETLFWRLRPFYDRAGGGAKRATNRLLRRHRR